jgi:hypothetical protein
VAVALVASSTSGTTDAQGTSRAVPVPAGAAAGHVAVLVLELWQSTATNPTVTWPSGFVEIVNFASSTDGFQKIKAARKVLTGADSGSYTPSWSSTHWNQGQCTLWSGVDNTTPLDVAVSTAQVASGTAYPSNSLTTSSAGCGMLHLIANENSSTSTAPTGYTEQQEANYLKTNTKIAGSAGSESISGGGVSTSTVQLGALIALRPASGGGGNSQAITPATETNAAITPAQARSRAITSATETDTAVSPSQARATTITPATETDTAVTPAQSRVIAISPAIETDVGVAPAHPGGQVITPALEADTAVTPTRARSQAVTPATELDVAVTVTQARSQAITPAAETDTGVAPYNPNALYRDLDWAAVVETGRWSATIESDTWTATVEPARWLTEVENA